MFPHDDKTFAVGGNVWKTGEPLETSAKNATVHEMLVRQEMLSNFLHVSPKVLSESIPHICRIVLRSGWHRINVLDHLEDGCIGGLVDELEAIRRVQDLVQALCDMTGSLESGGVLPLERIKAGLHFTVVDVTVLQQLCQESSGTVVLASTDMLRDHLGQALASFLAPLRLVLVHAGLDRRDSPFVEYREGACRKIVCHEHFMIALLCRWTNNRVNTASFMIICHSINPSEKLFGGRRLPDRACRRSLENKVSACSFLCESNLKA